MKKLTKVLLTSLLTAIMVIGFSTTAFASTHGATVHIARRDTRTNPFTVTAFTELPGQTITLTVDSGDTLQQVVNAALAKQTTDSGSTFSAGWVNTGTYQYLDSMTLAGQPYAGSYTIVNWGTNQHKYTGTAWVWNYSGGSDYPSDYMDQTTIGLHTDIYLYYETSEFIY